MAREASAVRPSAARNAAPAVRKAARGETAPTCGDDDSALTLFRIYGTFSRRAIKDVEESSGKAAENTRRVRRSSQILGHSLRELSSRDHSVSNFFFGIDQRSAVGTPSSASVAFELSASATRKVERAATTFSAAAAASRSRAQLRVCFS